MRPEGSPAPRRFGTPGGEPALLLHCSLARSGAWRGVAERLGSRLAMTAPDLPGHGRAEPWDRARDFHDQATEAARAALPDGPGGVHLVGHSFGATVALRLALEGAPVRTLTLIEPVLFAAAKAAGHRAYEAHATAFALVEAAFRAGERERAAALFSDLWGAGEPWEALPTGARAYQSERIELIFAGTPALEGDRAGLLAPGRLEGLEVPVLLVEGDRPPPVIGAVGRALAARLPNARRVAIPGAGHMAPLTHPEAVAEAVHAHLATAPAGP